MDTRWKNLIKITAFLVLLISFVATAFFSTQIFDKADVILPGSFGEYGAELHRKFYELDMILDMQSEEYIVSGEYLRDSNTVGTLWNMSKHEQERHIRQQLSSYRSAVKSLSEAEHIYYYAARGENVVANIEWPLDMNYNAYMSFDGMCTTSTFEYVPGSTTADKIFVAYDNTYAAELQQTFNEKKTQAYDELQLVLFSAIPGLLALFCLIWLCGGSFKIDALWNEAILFLIFVVVMAYLWISITMWKSGLLNAIPWTFAAISGVFCLAGTALLLMFVRNIKNGRLIKGMLAYKIFAWIGRVFRDIMRLTALNLKLGGAVLGGMIVTAITGAVWASENGEPIIFLMLIIEAVAVLWVVLKYIMRPYDDEVAARLSVEVDAKMKSERLKTELITNVSHDLKTPLTAILNYSDLLLKRNPKDEYAKIINEKGQQLRALTEDLFEVSRAESGNMSVKMETLDLAELLEQTLAELDENEVDFKINLKERAFVADGQLMARVFGNLAGNIVKYSLTGTRAYIDSFECDGKTVITFKNIASYSMNFDSDEIIERFRRGDASRATQGNGLGLAIAKSYVEACKGEFDVKVDGDLFKVTIKI